MQPSQLSDLLQKTVCKAAKYRNDGCGYKKVAAEIDKYYDKAKTLPPTFCRELLDFKIPCKHRYALS